LEDVEAEYLIELFLNWQNKNDFESFQLLEVKEVASPIKFFLSI
jgi:hypothetical protein